MAISLTTSYAYPLSNRKSFNSVSSSSSMILSSISPLRFPSQIRRFGLRRATVNSPSPSSSSPPYRFSSLTVRAKKQTFNSFDDLIQNSDKPVLVDFYATWCGPCQLMVPILNEVGKILKDKITVVKIDAEEYPSLADKYQVEALPTFILFKDGKLLDRFEGALRADQMVERIEKSLKVKQ